MDYFSNVYVVFGIYYTIVYEFIDVSTRPHHLQTE